MAIVIGSVWILFYLITIIAEIKSFDEYHHYGGVSKGIQYISNLLPLLFTAPFVLMLVDNGIRQRWSKTSTTSVALIAVSAIATIIQVIAQLKFMGDDLDYDKVESLQKLYINFGWICKFTFIAALGFFVDSIKSGATKTFGIVTIVILTALWSGIATLYYYDNNLTSLVAVYAIWNIALMAIIFCYKFDTKK